MRRAAPSSVTSASEHKPTTLIPALRPAIAAARLRLLVERREMVGPKEGLPTEAHLYKRMPGERGV